VSILVASFFGRSQATDAHHAGDPTPTPAPSSDDAVQPSVQQIIDHTDQDLSG
jgi:hypothetical protein